MAWYFFIRKTDGALVSEGSSVPATLDTTVYDTVDVVNRPDWTTVTWNAATRTLVARPIPITIDRLDDIQAWLLSDTDFASVWNSLTPARRTTLRLGLNRVFTRLLEWRRFRQPDEPVELG